MQPQGKKDVSLVHRRKLMESEWSSFVDGNTPSQADSLRDSIASSWERSSRFVAPTQDHAPLEDSHAIHSLWEESPMHNAARQVQDELSQLAREGSLVAAIADPQGRLLWTFASNHMRKRAESVNFTTGGCWDEASAGTNAVGLALAIQRPTTVFSAEHFSSYVHDWVCYASPIVHPQTKETVGVLDISTTWDRYTPLGQAAVAEFARSIAKNLPVSRPQADLEIRALGMPRVIFRGKEIHVSQRQLEILCLLVLNPQGLTLGAFHAALYGDAPVALGTLKAELSHLRSMLDGMIGSRPYRLLMSVWADFVTLWKVLRNKNTEQALSLYRGPFLPHSASPELEEWRNCIEVVVEKVVDSCRDPNLLMTSLCQGPQGSDLVRERLTQLAAKEKW